MAAVVFLAACTPGLDDAEPWTIHVGSTQIGIEWRRAEGDVQISRRTYFDTSTPTSETRAQITNEGVIVALSHGSASPPAPVRLPQSPVYWLEGTPSLWRDRDAVDLVDPVTGEPRTATVVRRSPDQVDLALGDLALALTDGQLTVGPLQVTRGRSSLPRADDLVAVLSAPAPTPLHQPRTARVVEIDVEGMSPRVLGPQAHLGGNRWRIEVPLAAEVPRRPAREGGRGDVERWIATVSREVRYAPNGMWAPAGAAVASGRGDCTEMAELFVQLARSEGVSAEVITGAVYIEQRQAWVPHAWAMVRLPGFGQLWVDPALQQPVADAARIALTQGSPDGWAMLALAQARIDVHQVRY